MDLIDFHSSLNYKGISLKKKNLFFYLEIYNFLNWDRHNWTNEFLDSLTSNPFIPSILQQTRINSRSNTLAESILWNIVNPDIISDNLTACNAIIGNVFGNTTSDKSDI